MNTRFTIPSLDGVRAVAVLIVFIGHGFSIGGIWPGHVGVTVFFFLSGFLITTLLRREYVGSGRISVKRFYLRRALRILPPAYITIVVAVLIGHFGVLPASTSGLGVLAEFLNVTNYYMIFFGREGLPPETSMLWSLSVEEHFYLLLPAVLFLMLRRMMSWRVIGTVFLAACVVALAWRLFLFNSGGSNLHLYVGSDTRFDGLLAGAAMALLFNPSLGDATPFGLKDSTIKYILTPIAAVVFAVSAMAPTAMKLTFVDSVQYLCLMVIFWFIVKFPRSLIGRILNHRWVVHLGVLSFSIYLLHRIVIALFASILEVEPLIDLVSLIVTIILAQLMWLLVERPLARVRKRLESKSKRPSDYVELHNR